MTGFLTFLVAIILTAFGMMGIWLLIWRRGRARRIIRHAKNHPADSLTDIRHEGF